MAFDSPRGACRPSSIGRAPAIAGDLRSKPRGVTSCRWRGVVSSADWTSPVPGGHASLSELVKEWSLGLHGESRGRSNRPGRRAAITQWDKSTGLRSRVSWVQTPVVARPPSSIGRAIRVLGSNPREDTSRREERDGPAVWGARCSSRYRTAALADHPRLGGQAFLSEFGQGVELKIPWRKPRAFESPRTQVEG